ncbi:hypothetical protein F5Y16DRAFT_365328 [Xylariaceae sp. FL0255]|nr:hypothetical protein F5Y16DRAFT_365328 [Xylariaceae sp. FL0255]
MPPLITAGATVAAFIFTVISWYNMLRTSVQRVHDDIEASQTVREDIRHMLSTMAQQENQLERWRDKWLIDKSTPDSILLEFWGPQGFNIIQGQLKRIKADLEKSQKKLRRYIRQEEDRQRARWPLRLFRNANFIFTKKDYVDKLIRDFPRNLATVTDESDAAWGEQVRHRFSHESFQPAPYHVLAAYSLIRIANQSRSDAVALELCCTAVQHNFVAIVDLDIFNTASSSSSAQKDAPRISEVLGAGHLRIELLVREASEPEAQLSRLEVERSTQSPDSTGRVVDAFRRIFDNQQHASFYHNNATTIYSLRMKAVPIERASSRLRHTFRDILAQQQLPALDGSEQRFQPRDRVFDEKSNYRAAFELAQACCLFFRTPWSSGICRCGIRCESFEPSEVHLQRGFHFGIESAHITHNPSLLEDPEGLDHLGLPNRPWCSKDFRWDALNKPLRHLGLLLVEFALETPVIVETSNTIGDAEVTDILIKTQQGFRRFTREEALNLVQRSSHNNPQSEADLLHYMQAIRWCLTHSFPPSPTDDAWDAQLRMFYFQVVQRLRHIYDPAPQGLF